MPNIAKIYWLLYYFQGRITPIDVKENSGSNLTDYQVMIQLTSSWDGWSLVASDGSDIYFTDSSGNPLYFWIEKFDYTNKNAIIWVKIPSLPASSTIRIYLRFGVLPNPYSSYRDGTKTFDFFDDFNDGVVDTSKWDVGTQVYNNYVWENNGLFASNTDLQASESRNAGFYDIYGTVAVDTVSEDGVKCGWIGKGLRSIQTFDLSKGLIIEAQVNLRSWTKDVGFGLSMIQDKDNRVDGAWFDATTDLGSKELQIFKEEAGARSYTRGPALTPSTGIHRLKLIKDNANNFKFMFDTTSMTITSTFNSATSRIGLAGFGRYVGQSLDVGFDFFFARKYASAEPSITINPSIAPKDIEML